MTKGCDVNNVSIGVGTRPMKEIVRNIQVNIPFTMLYESYLPRFLSMGINPEIGVDAYALDRYASTGFERIGDALRERELSITLHAPFQDLFPGSVDPAVREVTLYRFGQTLKILKFFRPKAVVCHAGYDEKRHSYIRKDWLEKSLETWSWMAARVRNEGSRLMLENVFEKEPEELQELFEGLADFDVGFCLDVGHATAFGHKPLEYWLRVLAPYLAHLHLHDNNGRRDDHMALGQGGIDFVNLFTSLKSVKGELPIITLEPHREEDLVPSLEYLKSRLLW